MTAKTTKQSKRKVQLDAARAKNVVVLRDIIDMSLDQGDQLDALAKLSEAEQRKLAERAKQGDKVNVRVAVGKNDASAASLSLPKAPKPRRRRWERLSMA